MKLAQTKYVAFWVSYFPLNMMTSVHTQTCPRLLQIFQNAFVLLYC